MKKVIKFSKGFLPCAIISAIIIISGVIGFCVKGINLGLDFKPGLIEEVRVAPKAMTLTYSGSAQATIKADVDEFQLVISGAGDANKTEDFPYGKYPTVNALAEGLNKIAGITASVVANGDADSYSIYINSVTTPVLSRTPYNVYAATKDSAVKIDAVREALKDVKGISVKALGAESEPYFQVRVPVAGEETTNTELQEQVTAKLGETFGADSVAVVKTDFVGSSFSGTLAGKSVLVVIATMFLIWLYVSFRFHWDFALGSVLALVHDVLILFTFIIWTGTEFSTTVLAAVLTIIGYSINASVVILDRVRENMSLVQTKKFTDILDKSLTDTLSRSIITTVTTLFASVSLIVFNNGSIQDFAIVLTVGLISGAYSSVFICSGFIALVRRHWEPGANANLVRPRKQTKISADKNAENK